MNHWPSASQVTRQITWQISWATQSLVRSGLDLLVSCNAKALTRSITHQGLIVHRSTPQAFKARRTRVIYLTTALSSLESNWVPSGKASSISPCSTTRESWRRVQLHRMHRTWTKRRYSCSYNKSSIRANTPKMSDSLKPISGPIYRVPHSSTPSLCRIVRALQRANQYLRSKTIRWK